MELKLYKQIDRKRTVYKCIDGSGVDYVLVNNTDVLSKSFVYDITVYWIDKSIKRIFLSAEHKKNFLEDEKALTDAFNDDIKRFPCNCKYGWKDYYITQKDLDMLK